MPMFLTIGYGDRAGYDRTPEPLRVAAHEHDAWLASSGVRMGVAGTPVQVRNHGAAGTQTDEGPYLRSELPVAGFALVEAADLTEAINLVSQTPCAVAYGVVEVWPMGDAD